MLHAVGYRREDFVKPQVGVCSTWSQVTPCNVHIDELARQAFLAHHPRAAGIDWDVLKERGFQRLAVDASYAPFARGGFPTPSGKCEFYSARLASEGHDPLPTFVPPRESVGSNPALAKRGIRFLAVGSDMGFLRAGAAAALGLLKG